MTAKIIQLNEYRRSLVRCPINGVVFPQAYRHSGVSWAFRDGETASTATSLIPGTETHIGYSLDQGDDESLANPRWDPISRLDPAIDSGWVVLRHHKNHDRVKGYLDAHGDLDQEHNPTRMIWETPEGLFSVLHRPRTPGCPDHLLIYCAAIPHEVFDEDQWFKVIAPDGTELDDMALVPPEQEAILIR